MKARERPGEGRGRGKEKRGAVKEKATKGMKRRIHSSVGVPRQRLT